VDTIAHDSEATEPAEAPLLTVQGGALRVDQALQLLTRAGLQPNGTDAVGSAAWMQSVLDALCTLSSRDPLTGLVNRRQFEAALDREIDRVARAGETALLLLADIDHFKRVNDTYGHGAGDVVIQHIGRALQDCVRPMDTVARIGGEEFAIVLPNCAPAFGKTVAERIRASIAGTPIEVNDHVKLPITISLGGAFAPQWVRSSCRLWLERADLQLYRAKGEGRNRACLESPPISEVSAEERGLLFTPSAFVPDDMHTPS
jgi:diguanylate cyclase (GGDEF)-like protein